MRTTLDPIRLASRAQPQARISTPKQGLNRQNAPVNADWLVGTQAPRCLSMAPSAPRPAPGLPRMRRLAAIAQSSGLRFESRFPAETPNRASLILNVTRLRRRLTRP